MPAHIALLLVAVTTFAVVRHFVGELISTSGGKQTPGDDALPPAVRAGSSEADVVAWTALDELQFRRCVDRSSP